MEVLGWGSSILEKEATGREGEGVERMATCC
jgi:hypothetical protein